MQTSIFLAKLLGPVMTVVGLAVLLNGRAFHSIAEDFVANRALLFLSGLLIMPAGLAIVLTHNVWAADWRGLITLFGWLSAIGGAIRLLAPQYVVQGARAMLKQPTMLPIAGAIWIAAGLILCFFGYR